MRTGKAIGGRRLSAAATAAAADMDLGVLNPFPYGHYRSQPLIGCFGDIANHNSRTVAYRFDACGKGAYG